MFSAARTVTARRLILTRAPKRMDRYPHGGHPVGSRAQVARPSATAASVSGRP
jgi:hypothetical protein